MEQYGIADVGSNTMVLIIYRMESGIPVPVLHRSVAAHLIDEIHGGAMSARGIEKASGILKTYAAILDEHGVSFRRAFVTEPARNIDNKDQFLSMLSASGFQVSALSGEQEAAYDFLGSRLDCRGIHDGAAFDVGGGSSELIVFRDDHPVTAISLPLGCVRLAHLPLDTDACRAALEEARSAWPALQDSFPAIIGIGGTARAAGQLMDRLHGGAPCMQVSQLREMFASAEAGDPVVTDAIRKTVTADRLPVFLPGVHMILALADLLQATTIRVSATGVREGFLLTQLQETSAA